MVNHSPRELAAYLHNILSSKADEIALETGRGKAGSLEEYNRRVGKQEGLRIAAEELLAACRKLDSDEEEDDDEFLS